MTAEQAVMPVILAGGGGTRLWPLSRGYYPKQFLALDSDRSLLQQTLARVPPLANAALSAPMVVCNEEHRFLVAEQCRQAGVDLAALVLEPSGRNTAPALSAAACLAQRDGRDPVLVMMPADHIIPQHGAFGESIRRAVELAAEGRIVTLGVTPTRPETGYGYIELGARTEAGGPASFDLNSFREKPDAVTAAGYVERGGFLWNAGLYVVKASRWREFAARFCPQIAAGAEAAVAAGTEDGDFFRLDEAAFSACPANSIDYAVMEPLAGAGSEAAVVTLDAGWSDVGSWSSLWQVSDKDDAGNVLRGDICALEAQNNIVYAEHRLVATLGCHNLVIIETADSVMVAARERAEDVKQIVDWLAQNNREERLTHRRVYRPWGSYAGIDAGPGFQVKRITVKPGEALSLQLHHRRAEHWVVVSGTARVTRGDELRLLHENESIDIPIGVKHRLENPGSEPLELIEVQSGSYLGEDDIVRFEDRYRRH